MEFDTSRILILGSSAEQLHAEMADGPALPMLSRIIFWLSHAATTLLYFADICLAAALRVILSTLSQAAHFLYSEVAVALYPAYRVLCSCATLVMALLQFLPSPVCLIRWLIRLSGHQAFHDIAFAGLMMMWAWLYAGRAWRLFRAYVYIRLWIRLCLTGPMHATLRAGLGRIYDGVPFRNLVIYVYDASSVPERLALQPDFEAPETYEQRRRRWDRERLQTRASRLGWGWDVVRAVVGIERGGRHWVPQPYRSLMWAAGTLWLFEELMWLLFTFMGARSLLQHGGPDLLAAYIDVLQVLPQLRRYSLTFGMRWFIFVTLVWPLFRAVVVVVRGRNAYRSWRIGDKILTAYYFTHVVNGRRQRDNSQPRRLEWHT